MNKTQLMGYFAGYMQKQAATASQLAQQKKEYEDSKKAAEAKQNAAWAANRAKIQESEKAKQAPQSKPSAQPRTATVATPANPKG